MKPGRAPLPNPYTLTDESAHFYRRKALEGIYPTDLAVICLRNEEQRRGFITAIKPVRPVGRPKSVVKIVPLEKKQAAMKIRMALEQVEVRKPVQPTVVVSEEIDNRPPLTPMRISYLEAMSRKYL